MHKCTNCGTEFPTWNRICRFCKKEMTLEKVMLLPNFHKDIHLEEHHTERLPSGFNIFDKVFNGGFLKRYVYFIYAEKGAGKTTFLLQVCFHLKSIFNQVIYFCFDDSRDGINKKCCQYELSGVPPVFIFNIKNFTDLEASINSIKPDLVVIDSLQSMVNYNTQILNTTLNNLKTLSLKYNFSLVLIGEQRKDKSSYLGPSSLGHIVDVLIKLEASRNGELIISTPEKNRDTDDRVSRCFYKRTPKGLVQILESETGIWKRHSNNEKMGLAAFISENGKEYIADEITAAEIPDTIKPMLKIAGMNSDKSKGILAVLQNQFLEISSDYILRANYFTRLSNSAELACYVSILSLVFNKPIAVNTVFIAGVDNQGFLFLVDGMENYVERAKALGYERIIGPKANHPVQSIWEEAETLKEVWEKINES